MCAAAFVLRWPVRVPWPTGWDAVDFALALDFFDLRRMQPHFPGYPVLIWLSRWLQALIPDPIGALTALSALAGVAAVYPIAALGRRLGGPVAGLTAAALWAVHPLARLTAAAPMSDSLGVLWLLLVLAGAAAADAAARRGEAARAQTFSAVAGAVCGLLLGTRLSNAPALVALAVLSLRWVPFLGGAIVTTWLWAAWLAGREGWPSLLALAQGFIAGHFRDWGGTAWSPGAAGPIARAGLVAQHALGPGSAAWWAFAGIGAALVAAPWVRRVALANRPWPAGRPLLAAWTALSMGWAVLGQNVAEPRHVLPLVPPLCLGLGLLIARVWPAGPSPRSGAPKPRRTRDIAAAASLAGVAGVFMAWCWFGQALVIEQSHVPPPVVQLADFLERRPQDAPGVAARSVVFTWEEERVIEYRHPVWIAIRARRPAYWQQAVAALPAGTAIFVTSPVIDGLPPNARGAVAPVLTPVARFRGNPVLYPGYADLTLFRADRTALLAALSAARLQD